MNTTIEMIKELRKRTGVGPMFCKEALQACGNNADEAVEYLKAKGLETARQREMTREREVRVLAASSNSRLALAAVSCESDFVADSAELKAALEKLVQKLLQYKKIDSGIRSNLEKMLIEETYFLKERIEIERLETLTHPGELVIYNHYNGKVGCGFWVTSGNTARHSRNLENLAMHIAATAPWFIRESDISEQTRTEWLDEFRQNLREEGKPEKLIEKIALGQLKKRISQKCLVNQKYLMDETVSVGEFLEKLELKINHFALFPM